MSDAKVARVSRDARLTFIYAITQADDRGLLAGAPRQLLGALFPLDDDVTAPLLLNWIEELVAVGLVRWRATRDGVAVLEIVNWSRHQRIDNAGRSQLSPLLADIPDDAEESRGESRQVAATGGDSPLGSTINDLGPTTTDQGSIDESARTGSIDEGACTPITALEIAIVANRAIADRYGEQPNPLTPASAGNLAEELNAAGVELETAKASIARQVRESKKDRPSIGSLAYFKNGIVADHEAEMTRRAIAVSDSGKSQTPKPKRRGAVDERYARGFSQ